MIQLNLNIDKCSTQMHNWDKFFFLNPYLRSHYFWHIRSKDERGNKMNSIDFGKLQVHNICDLIVSKPAIATVDCSLEKLFRLILENPITRHIYIVNENKILIGSIRLVNIAEYLFPELIFVEEILTSPIRLLESMNIETTYELMNNDPVHAYMDTSILDMIKIMKNSNIAELPIVNEKKEVIGEVDMLEVIKYCVDNFKKKGD